MSYRMFCILLDNWQQNFQNERTAQFAIARSRPTQETIKSNKKRKEKENELKTITNANAESNRYVRRI